MQIGSLTFITSFQSYKKFTRVMKPKLSHHKLRAIKSFREVPLSEILQNQYGIAPGDELEAKVHLYEAVPKKMQPTR